METAALNATSQICALKHCLSKTGFQMQAASILTKWGSLIEIGIYCPSLIETFLWQRQ